MLPFWLKLLRAHNKNRGYGLTLPFLIGATRTPVESVLADKEKNIAGVKQLLASIRDETPDTSHISLTVCDRLQQPVFAESSSYYKPSDLYARIRKTGSEECFLYVVPNILSQDNNNIESLTEMLWRLNGEAISNGLFSFSNGAFTKYAERDFSLIAGAKQINDGEEEV